MLGTLHSPWRVRPAAATYVPSILSILQPIWTDEGPLPLRTVTTLSAAITTSVGVLIATMELATAAKAAAKLMAISRAVRIASTISRIAEPEGRASRLILTACPSRAMSCIF